MSSFSRKTNKKSDPHGNTVFSIEVAVELNIYIYIYAALPYTCIHIYIYIFKHIYFLLKWQQQLLTEQVKWAEEVVLDCVKPG